MTQIHTCLNCSAEIRTGPFCERCGQRNVHVRLEFRDLVDDIRVQLLEWDLPWLYTIKEALLRPGKVCRAYIDGKRTRYVNPLKYVLYLIPVIVVLLGMLPRRYALYPEGFARAGGNFRDMPFLADYLVGNPVLLLMLLAPAVALVLRVVYTRDRYNNTEIVCWLLYSIGNGALIATLVHLGFELYLQHVLHIVQVSDMYFFNYVPRKILLIVAVVWLHTVYSASGFFGEAWYLTWLKILTVSLVYFGGFSLTIWALTRTADDSFQRGAPRVRPASALIGYRAWTDQEQAYVMRQDDPGVNAEYGSFLRIAGRSNDALYRLLLADGEQSGDPNYPARVALELSVAYLNLGRHDFALTQLHRFDTPKLRLLRLEAAMQRGVREDLPAVIREADILVDYNLLLAQLWSAGQTDAALDEVRRTTGSAGTQTNQLWMNARWAALLGDPALAWAIFRDQQDPRELWQSMWMPYFSGVRQLPEFKDYVRTEGLENYWRSTGNWPDICRPLGEDDFECF